MAKTKIVTTKKGGVGGGKAAKKKKSLKTLGKQVRRTHKGYTMKNIIKGQMTFKRRGHKR